MMDYRDEVFLKVAENLSFSKAAKELFISQPAVTKHIKEMEAKLKSSLFQRKANRIYLTKSGNLCYNYLKKIKNTYKELEFEIGLLNDTFKGVLKIGASSTISQYLIPKVIASFHKKYPKIEIFLLNGNSSQIEKKLLENEIDIALVENDASHPNIQYTDFIDDEIIIVTGSKSVYSKRKFLSLKDFYEIPIVLREKGSGTLQVVENVLAKQKISLNELNILIHLGTTEAIKNFLLNFDGIALVSEKAVEKELWLKEIAKLSIKNLNFNRKFRVALRQGHPSSSVKLFVDLLNKYNF